VINRGALLFFMGGAAVHACCVRDVTNDGAGNRLTGLNLVPSDFGISLDNFRTMRRCRLIWRDGDLERLSRANKQSPLSRGEMSVTLKSDVNLLIALPKHRSVLSFVAVERIGPTPTHTGPCVPHDQGSPRLAAPPKHPRGIPRKYSAVRPHSGARPARTWAAAAP
jgi:hypothetical protein